MHYVPSIMHSVPSKVQMLKKNASHLWIDWSIRQQYTLLSNYITGNTSSIQLLWNSFSILQRTLYCNKHYAFSFVIIVVVVIVIIFAHRASRRIRSAVIVDFTVSHLPRKRLKTDRLKTESLSRRLKTESCHTDWELKVCHADWELKVCHRLKTESLSYRLKAESLSHRLKTESLSRRLWKLNVCHTDWKLKVCYTDWKLNVCHTDWNKLDIKITKNS